jgi:hypothetical protein
MSKNLAFINPFICDQSPRTVPAIGLSLGPAKRNPVVVGFSYIFVNITAKLFRIIGVRTNIELAFIDEKGRWIDVFEFAFAQVISAEGSGFWRLLRL